ncbi:MAG TPA: hypothetical protein VMK12_25870 [Anaeromyxobacteraceae bacterium]|nr:hypothetical protein [Anaeromyxobacteraceae bacterium]
MSLVAVHTDEDRVLHACDFCGAEHVRSLRCTAAEVREQLRRARPDLAAELDAVSLPALAELLAVAEAHQEEVTRDSEEHERWRR